MTELSRVPPTVSSASRESLDSRSRPVLVSIVSTPRNRAVLAIALLVLFSSVLVAPFVPGLFGALMLYVLAAGPYQRLARRAPPSLSAGVVILGLLVLVIAPLLWLLVHLVEEAPKAMAAAQASNLLGWLSQLHIGNVAIGEELSKGAGTIASWLSEQAFTFVGSLQAVVINVMISIFGLYYLLTGPPGLWESVREYIPFSAATADAVRDRFVSVTQATVVGSGVVVLAQGVLISFAFSVTGLSTPLFWGAVAMVAAILPVFGSSLVWVPAALFLLSHGRYPAAATMFVIGTLGSNISHLLRPLLNRRMTNIHPMITLVGGIAGILKFGLIGILLGPLAITLAFEMLRFFREEYLGPSESRSPIAVTDK